MTKRPVILDTSGQLRELPVGDSLPVQVFAVEVDFGAAAQRVKVFAVTHAGAQVGMRLMTCISGEAPTGKSADEMEMDTLTVSGRVSATNTLAFTVRADGPVSGKFILNYQLST